LIVEHVVDLPAELKAVTASMVPSRLRPVAVTKRGMAAAA
jgi:hypothetical protein